MPHKADSNAVPPIRLVFWESTSLCNLACIHCRRHDVAEELSRLDMETEPVKALLRELAAMGRPIFVFSGGEPLVRPDWMELAQFAAELRLPTALATNGTLVDAQVAGLIRQAGFARVSISFDGADADTHDRLRAVPGSFQAATAGAGHLVAAGVPIQINSTITRQNLHQLNDLHALALRLGAAALHLFLLVPVGCGAQIEASHQITPQEYEEVLNWVCDRQADSSLQLKATCGPHYYRVAAQRQAGKRLAAVVSSGPTHSRGCCWAESAWPSSAIAGWSTRAATCPWRPATWQSSLSSRSGATRPSSASCATTTSSRASAAGAASGASAEAAARALAASGSYLGEEPMCCYEP